MDSNPAGFMFLHHAPCPPLPKSAAAQGSVKHRQPSPGPIPLGAHPASQCGQVVVSSLASTHTHAPWPGCTSIHSYCRQQPGLHPIPRENFRQSQFPALCAACSGTQSPACGRRDRVIYSQGQGDQPLSTNELFHRQWGQRKPTPGTRPARPQLQCPMENKVPLSREPVPRHSDYPAAAPDVPGVSPHPTTVFSLPPQPLHYLSPR